MVLRRWLRQLLAPAPARSRRPKTRRTPLRLEVLEDRTLPAIKLLSVADPSFNSGSSTSNGFSQAYPPGTVSDDGNFVVFTSKGSNLIAGQSDSNNAEDVFLYDKQNDALKLISRKAGTSTTTGNGASIVPYISGDGKWVAFFSTATDLIQNTSVSDYQLYLYDRVNDSLKLVSHKYNSTSTGVTRDDIPFAGELAVSDDGKYIAYICDTYDLVENYTSSNTFWTQAGFLPKDAYLYNRETDTTTLVSHTSSSSTRGGNDFTTLINISGNGGTVVFHSYSTNLISGQNESTDSSTLDIFLYDVSDGSITLVTHDPDDGATPTASAQDRDDFAASISDDGTRVVYKSKSTNLVDGQSDPGVSSLFGTQPDYDIFLFDATTDTNILVSRKFGTTTTAATAASVLSVQSPPVISGDGKYVAFASNATDLLSSSINTGGTDNVYLFEVSTGNVTLLSFTDSSSTSPAGGGFASITDDGSAVVFARLNPGSSNPPEVSRYTRSTGTLSKIANIANSSSGLSSATYQPSISENGSTIVINSVATTLVANDNNSTQDVFITKEDTPSTPTNITISVPGVPEAADVAFATLGTVATGTGRTFTYSLVTGTGSADNAFFTIVGDTLRTGNNFPNGTQTTYNIRIRTTDAAFNNVFFEKAFTLELVKKPTDLTLSVERAPTTANTTFATISVTAEGQNRTFNYFLVDGTGSADNQYFSIINNQLQTGNNFPNGAQAQYQIRLRVVDATYASLTYEEAFTIIPVTPPTDMTLSSLIVPAFTETNVGTLTTTATGTGRTFSYSLVTGSTDNALFTLSGSTLRTDTDFPTGVDGTYSVRIRTTDTEFPSLFYEESFVITARTPPTDLSLSTSTFAAVVGAVAGTMSTTATGTGRTFGYSLVSGTGDTHNSLFVIDGDKLKTDTDFPTGVDGTYSVRIRTTDTQFSSLFREESFTVMAIAGIPEPIIEVVAVTTGEGSAAALDIDVRPVDPATQTITSITIAGVTNGATLSAGTNNGDGTWTLTTAQLDNLMITVPDNGVLNLEVSATAEAILGGITVSSSGSKNLAVTVTNVAPTVTVTGPAQFNPNGVYTLNLTGFDPGNDTITSVTVNWGDGTVEVFSGFPVTLTHKYMVLDSAYQIVVSVTDEDGTFGAANTPTADAELPTVSQGVVAQLYVDLLGREADMGGLMGWSGLLDQVGIEAVVRGIMASVEYREGVIRDLYLRYLGREVDPVGLANALAAFNSLALSGVDVELQLAAGILSSDEFYFNVAGGTNAGFLQALYRLVLGREIEAEALALRLASLDAGASRLTHVLSVLRSEEYRTEVVDSFYEELLLRPPDKPGSIGWIEALNVQSQAEVLVAFLSTPEFTMRLATF